VGTKGGKEGTDRAEGKPAGHRKKGVKKKNKRITYRSNKKRGSGEIREGDYLGARTGTGQL